MSASAPARTVSGSSCSLPATEWDWETIDQEVRPIVVSLGRRRFSLHQEESLDLYHQLIAELLERRTVASVSPAALLVAGFQHKAINLRAKRTRQAAIRLRELAPESVDPRDSINAACFVSSALSRLDPRCRELLRLHQMEGYSPAESADAVGLSHGKVHLRVNRCLDKIRRLSAST